VAVAAAGAGWIGVAGVLARSSGSVPIGCPFKTLTGLDCPGCGSTRSLGALTRFDLGAALDHNVLVPFALVFVVASFVAWTRAVWRRPDPAAADARFGATDLIRHPGLIAAVGVVFLAFAVVRNLELGSWLASGLAT
jgi:hypothetical protein